MGHFLPLASEMRKVVRGEWPMKVFAFRAHVIYCNLAFLITTSAFILLLIILIKMQISIRKLYWCCNEFLLSRGPGLPPPPPSGFRATATGLAILSESHDCLCPNPGIRAGLCLLCVCRLTAFVVKCFCAVDPSMRQQIPIDDEVVEKALKFLETKQLLESGGLVEDGRIIDGCIKVRRLFLMIYSQC